MGWMIFFFALWFVAVRGFGWGGCGTRRARLEDGWRGHGWEGYAGHGGHRGRHPGWRPNQGEDAAPRPSSRLTPAQGRERAISELRRRYVADEITVEEYEAGLDRVLRDPPHNPTIM